LAIEHDRHKQQKIPRRIAGSSPPILPDSRAGVRQQMHGLRVLQGMAKQLVMDLSTFLIESDLAEVDLETELQSALRRGGPDGGGGGGHGGEDTLEHLAVVFLGR